MEGGLARLAGDRLVVRDVAIGGGGGGAGAVVRAVRIVRVDVERMLRVRMLLLLVRVLV
jgi:hypothetical protein